MKETIESKWNDNILLVDAKVRIKEIRFDFDGLAVVHISGFIWVDTPLKGEGGQLATRFSQSFTSNSDHGERLLALATEIMTKEIKGTE